MSFFCVISSSGEEQHMRLRRVQEGDENNEKKGRKKVTSYRPPAMDGTRGRYPWGGGGPSQEARGRQPPAVVGDRGGIPRESSVVNGQERYRSEIKLHTGQTMPHSNSYAGGNWSTNEYHIGGHEAEKTSAFSPLEGKNRRDQEPVEGCDRNSHVFEQSPSTTLSHSTHQPKLRNAGQSLVREGKPPPLPQATRNGRSMSSESGETTPSPRAKVGELRHRWEVLSSGDPPPMVQMKWARDERTRGAKPCEKQPPKVQPKPKSPRKQRSQALTGWNQPDGVPSEESHAVGPCQVAAATLPTPNPTTSESMDSPCVSRVNETISLDNQPVNQYSYSLPSPVKDGTLDNGPSRTGLHSDQGQAMNGVSSSELAITLAIDDQTVEANWIHAEDGVENANWSPAKAVVSPPLGNHEGDAASQHQFPPMSIVEEAVLAQEATPCEMAVRPSDIVATEHRAVRKEDLSNENVESAGEGTTEIDGGPSMKDESQTKIFFRAGALVQLEDKRDRQLSVTIERLQAHCRGYLARQKLKQLKIQLLAVTCIQRNVRKFLAVKNWPWWRLVTKVLPLLDVHRTEEELKMKDIELDQLRAKVAKLETERNTLKQNVDKMDSRITELSADLSEEHTAATHASEMLEVETAERLRLEKEVKELRSNYNALQRKSEKMEMEVMEHRMVRSSIIEADMSSDEDGDSVYRLKYMQLRKEMELGKKRLQQEHEEQLETMATTRKSVERKLMEALEEAEEYKRQVVGFKRRSQKLVEESQDMKLHLESQTTRNSDLEKKQRRFDTELSKVQQDMQHEKSAKERLQREKDKIQGENFLLTQQLEDMRSEVKLKEDKIEQLTSEMEDLSSHDTMEVKEVAALKKAKRELETKLQDQEEELDDQAGQIQQLEQTKLRYEMQLERLKKSHQKELDAKDEEVEEVRASAQNKVKQMEIQLEEDYEERQSVMREKRELERRVQELLDKPAAVDRDSEKRLRRDLKKTKALLKDAQTMLDRQNAAAPSGAKLKQLKNELEDAHFATASAVKGRQNLEAELSELQTQLDDMMRAKADAEEKLSVANRDKTEIESKLEDQEEDFNDLLKKHRALIHQMSMEQGKIHQHLETINEMSTEKQELQEKISELQSKLDFMTESMVDKAQMSRLEAKARDLEARLDLEQTTKNKLENQVERLRDSLDRSTSDHSSVQQKELRGQEASRKLQRELRELREEHAELQRKESESSQRRHALELEAEGLQSSNEQLQSDLKLAFKRIADLQSALEDDIGSDSECSVSGSDSGDSDSEGDYVPRYSQYSSNRSSRLSSASSVDSSRYRRSRVYSSTSERSEDVVRRARTGKYVINPGSSDEDLDEVEARSTSRPSSLYSEDTVGSTDLADTNISLTGSTSLGGGGALEGGDGPRKKGFTINPDYM